MAVSQRAWDARKGGASVMFIDTTMTPKVDELLKGMIVQSGNDASIALAEAVSGSVETFVAQMNTQAAAWGLIWECVEDADFAARVDAIAKQLSTAPTKALVRTRQAMHAAPGHTLEQQLSFEGSFMRELGWSPDYAEGVAAFMEKRAPKFTGE